MSKLTDLVKRPARRLNRTPKHEQEAAKAAAKAPAKPEPAKVTKEESKELRDQRDRLLEKFTVMQADLGGAFYEMAIRDHVRLDVLTRKAAELQRVDAELLAVERLLELERADAAGLCPSCGSPFGAADRFCPQCGHSLVPTHVAAPPATNGNGAAPTTPPLPPTTLAPPTPPTPPPPPTPPTPGADQ